MEVLDYLNHYTAAYTLIGAVIAWALKVYWIDIKGNKKEVDSLKKEVEDNNNADIDRDKQLALMDRKFDHVFNLFEIIARELGIKNLPKFNK